MKVARAALGLVVGAARVMALGGAASAAPVAPTICATTNVTNQVFTINGATYTPTQQAMPGLPATGGDTVSVSFNLAARCTVSLVSYSSTTPGFNLNQTVFQSQTITRDAGGTYTLTVVLPAGGSTAGCSPNQHDNSNGGGANQSPGPYDPSGCGLPSGNGKSTDNNSSKPCAGCVGNADAKNPPGQYPNGSDPNAGYECDRNQGVGQTNPAHSGCTGLPFWQLDFVTGNPITNFNTQGTYDDQGRLINYANSI